MKNIFITQRISKNKKYKEVRDSLDQRFIEFIKIFKIVPIIVPNSIFDKKNKNYINNYIKAFKPKGLILTGGDDLGKYKYKDQLEFVLLKYFTQKKLPILGICRGMEILSVFFGSKLKKVNKHSGTYHNNISLIKGCIYQRKVNSYHNFSIKKCPDNFVVTAKSFDGEVEAIKHKKYNWEGWMWHPERDKKFDQKHTRN